MRRLNVMLLALLLSLSTLSFAQEALEDTQDATDIQSPSTAEVPVSESQKPEGPVKTIQTAIVKLNQLTTVAAYSPQLVNTLIKTEVAPLFDFEHIASEILLVSNLNLGADEQAYFANKIKKNIITSLLSRLTQTRSTSFQFISARPMIGGSIAVKLKVNGYYSYGMFLDIVFHQTANQDWKISDVVLNNDSLINYYQKMVLIKLRRYGVYGMLGRL
ncbi:ABC transporter substrate-binding protein [Candidatus Thioglobus autotrophicus]|uniref:ABC transporter substrate-binding protein n=1 Tax=Candidatus Thioglobus autotrophicus TaxID=1705394 RepID=UPI00299ECC04|nr:ABC transporter substrate-binding protein [Candidatus Thioglobus autotrophicus]WPE17091.1 ABC transporter substrate-binding protein [Candidatus Thioglobus autotrophicus]WPE18645.1 ABC transporter substrate-binding protein [Candidatus Thioglobus autotrophicus]